MLGPAWFRLPHGDVQPFAVAPWSDDSGPAFDALPRVIQRLRGEWPCIPFGLPDDGQALPPKWRPSIAKTVLDPYLHGFGSNEVWENDHLTEDSITLIIEYPAYHHVRQLRRTVRVESSRPAISCSLTIEVREPCALPIGLHPTFRLPQRPRGAALEFAGGAARCWTMPTQPQPGVSVLAPGRSDVPLSAVPLAASGSEDLTRLPLPYETEDIVLVTNPGGAVRLSNDAENYAVSLWWDEAVFPTCQLWLSNRGRAAYPWCNRFLALGVEPLAAAFDLGVATSCRPDNPLWNAGLACTVQFSPDHPLHIEYEISVEAIDNSGLAAGASVPTPVPF